MPEENNIQEVTNKSRVEQLLEAWAGGEQIELWAPQSNIERILMNILGADGVDINPIQSRNEALLLQILENGGGSGGGGSSDFSTAELTLVGEFNGSLPLVIDNEWYTGLITDSQTFESGTYLIALYKGNCTIGCSYNNAEVSGNATFDPEFSTITITGDCTITIPS